jgi:hypothetical protein
MEQKKSCVQSNETIVHKRENIKKICKVVYIILTIGVIVWGIYGVMLVLEDIWVSMGLPMETITISNIGWFSFEEAHLLRFEGTGVFIPIIDTGWIPAGFDNVIVTTIFNVFVVSLFMTFWLFIRSIFKDLKNGGSPFSRKISIAAYFVSAFIFFDAVHSGRLHWEFAAIFPAALVGLLGFVFDYGRILQEESDTTL